MAVEKVAISTVTPDPVVDPNAKLYGATLPEEYRDKPYLKDIAAMPEGPDALKALLKKMDNAQGLIGKKSGVPASDAPAEEWETFYTALRPAKEDDYTIGKAKDADPEFIKRMKTIFHEAGVSDSMAGKIEAGFMESAKGQSDAQVAAQKKLDDEFDVLSKATFGADNDAKLKQAEAMIKKHLPENLKPYEGKLSNEAMVVLSAVLNNVHEEYGVEDDLDGKGGSSGVSVSELREQAVAALKDVAFTDEFHKDHEQAKAKVKDLYERVAAGARREKEQKDKKRG